MKRVRLSKRSKKLFNSVIIILVFLSGLAGQENKSYVIRGRLLDSLSREPLMFATVAVRRQNDATFLIGVSAGLDGSFVAGPLGHGSYEFQISALGYEKKVLLIDNKDDADLGNIFLQQKIAQLEEVTIAGERIKARNNDGKTTYFMNEKLYGISGTGVDLLSYIPGIKVDLTKNISVNGSSDVIVYVDGKERDSNYINQLDPERIDRVEILNAPGSRYDATISGVINIFLKEKPGNRINGHLFADIPVFKSFVYSFPDFSADYNLGDLDLSMSYAGAFSYFNIIESDIKKIERESVLTEINSGQFVRQKDWSHTFHFGVDYKPNKNNQLSLFYHVNPFSREFDGDVEYHSVDAGAGERILNYTRDDTDKNINSHISLWYRHGFDKPGRELTLEMNYSNFKAFNGTSYIANSSTDLKGDFSNLTKPLQNSLSFRIDYTIPLAKKLRFDAGLKTRIQVMKDRLREGFNYGENVFAAYGSVSGNIKRYSFTAGFRAEKSETGLRDNAIYSGINILPQLSVIRKLTNKQSLEFSYNATLYRPNIYELNSHTSYSDPLSTVTGNPDLEMEITHKLKLAWSKSSGDNFFTSGIFFEIENNSINRYAVVLENGIVESRIANLGTIGKYGAQFSGSFRLNKIITLNPWLRIYNMYSEVNELARTNYMSGRQKHAFETSVSAIASLKHGFALSMQLQYSSQALRMQSDYFSDALWMISAEKTFLRKFKAGVVTALPFTGSFTYHGSKTETAILYMHSEGDLKLPAFPVWFRLRYQFSSGEKKSGKNSEREDIINIPKKGF